MLPVVRSRHHRPGGRVLDARPGDFWPCPPLCLLRYRAAPSQLSPDIGVRPLGAAGLPRG